MPCDPVGQVSSDLVGPLGIQTFFSTHQYPKNPVSRNQAFNKIKQKRREKRLCIKVYSKTRKGQAIKLMCGLVKSHAIKLQHGMLWMQLQGQTRLF